MTRGRRGSAPLIGGGAAVAPNPPHHRLHLAGLQRRQDGLTASLQDGSVLSARVLMAADLVAFDCAVDGLRHLIDDRVHAEALGAEASAFEALCGRMVIAESMCADPRPVCPRCVALAAPRVAAVTTPHRRWRTRRTGSNGAVRQIVGVVGARGRETHAAHVTAAQSMTRAVSGRRRAVLTG